MRTARSAVHDHVLFDGPHDRPTALLDHAGSQELFAAVLRCPGAVFEAYLGELRRQA